jgi:hypothetical protein
MGAAMLLQQGDLFCVEGDIHSGEPNDIMPKQSRNTFRPVRLRLT